GRAVRLDLLLPPDRLRGGLLHGRSALRPVRRLHGGLRLCGPRRIRGDRDGPGHSRAVGRRAASHIPRGGSRRRQLTRAAGGGLRPGASPSGKETGMTETADVVIVGGGVTGASIAYHLVHRGVRRVAVVERRFVASGATGRSSACIRQHYTTPQTCRMVL